MIRQGVCHKTRDRMTVWSRPVPCRACTREAMWRPFCWNVVTNNQKLFENKRKVTPKGGSSLGTYTTHLHGESPTRPTDRPTDQRVKRALDFDSTMVAEKGCVTAQGTCGCLQEKKEEKEKEEDDDDTTVRMVAPSPPPCWPFEPWNGVREPWHSTQSKPHPSKDARIHEQYDNQQQ